MDTIADYAVKPFLTDGEDFVKVLNVIENDRETISSFNNLTYGYENAYAPLSFLLKPISMMCQKEVRKLDKQIKILKEICAIYKAVGGVVVKGKTAPEERALAKTTLDVLVEKFLEHEEVMRHWHPLLKDKIFYMHQSRENAKHLINELY